MSPELPDGWMPVGGIVLEDAADQAMRHEGNVLVTAGPGSGKTELLAQKACYLLQTNGCRRPYKILAVSFKADAARNLADRVEERCGDEGKERFSSLTFDAFAKMVVDHFRRGLPEWLRPTSDYVLSPLKEDAFLIESARIFEFYKPKSLENEVINSVKLMRDTEPLRFLLRMAPDGRSHLTFPMVFALAQCILDTNPLVADAVRKTFSHVFLDEFQDITRDQYQMIRGLFHGTRAMLTAVGDNKQRIMLWAGAMRDAFDQFSQDYNPSRFHLLMNYRSAPRLVDLQTRMYSVLNEDAPKPLPAGSWKDEDGEIRLLISGDDFEEARWLADDIKKAVDGGVVPNEICIVFKQRVADYSNKIYKELKERGIAARIEADYQEILDDRFMVFLLEFALMSAGSLDPKTSEAVRELAMSIRRVPADASYADLVKHERWLVGQIKEMHASFHHLRTSEDVLNVFSTLCDSFEQSAILFAFPEYRREGLLDRRIAKMSELLFKDMRAFSSVRDGIKRMMGKDVIPMMTIHKSKGLEYKRVYLVGLEDDAFWSFSRQPEETRCAFFVAISRAVESLTFTYCESRNEEQQSRQNINEFYSLLCRPGVAEVVDLPSKC